MLRRRKLKPCQVDPSEEAYLAAEWDKQIAKAKRMMSAFDTLPPVCREALTKEPTGSIAVGDVKQMADKITRGELPVDHTYLANHVVTCGTKVYRDFMDEQRREMERRPAVVFRKKKPSPV